MFMLTELDLAIRSWFQDLWAPWLDRMFGEITTLGGTAVLTLVTLGALGILLRQGERIAAVRFVTSILLAKCCCSALKWFFARQRPDLSHPLVALFPPLNESFPSGHALMSTVIYGSVVILAEQFGGLTHSRHFLRIYAGLVVLLVGVSRMYLGVHFFTDVVAGWALGFLWLVATNQYLRKRTANGVGFDSVRRVEA